ncbi:1-deoxy-D-xylulose-5-phosphate reductoisomerase [candidate division WOR-3 bacterium]|nr:1-deoxy-D-xylulose-5-phosphate reductoisomerase [candidate division WOR-3 bacterium]
MRGAVEGPLPVRQKRVAVFGSTGSVGTACLQVLRHLGPEYRVSALAAARSVSRIVNQAREFRPEFVVLTDWDAFLEARRALGPGVKVGWGPAALLDAARADVVVMAMSGTQGLLPVLRSLELGQRTCLATKEILVAFGEPVMRLARRNHAEVLPIDSELCAVHQCLGGQDDRSMNRVILTASGGPFLNRPLPRRARLAQVLNHPTWKMGRKITVDSATLMNKGLEVIETARLFGLEPSQVEAVVHPQSVVHSMVVFNDGSVMAQLSEPDMRLPLQYCLTWPRRSASLARPLDLTRTRRLEFLPVDRSKFRCLDLAYRALTAGGGAPCCLSSANQVAVDAFLDGRIAFGAIPDIVEQTLYAFSGRSCPPRPGIKHLLKIETWATRHARSLANQQRNLNE